MNDLPDTTTPDGIGRITGALDHSILCDLIHRILEAICS